MAIIQIGSSSGSTNNTIRSPKKRSNGRVKNARINVIGELADK